eukprot:TRINITY_DN2004_c0_g1_i1.p1 TRINITY_DN2004_c0_g1~~TRINITY_DN2004_c0_g1_i1.p1  ORF type:complete len:701 (-),score=205.79 TRINITY_DN2004_c0_g1_i1:62-2164(-)
MRRVGSVVIRSYGSTRRSGVHYYYSNTVTRSYSSRNIDRGSSKSPPPSLDNHPRAPNLTEVESILQQNNKSVSSTSLFHDSINHHLTHYRILSALPDFYPPALEQPTFPRTPPGVQPLPHINPFNAWVLRTSVRAPPTTSPLPLNSWRVAINDNISLAGFPLTHGSRSFPGYTSDYDATVVSRLLSAGAEIVGKTNVEEFSLSVDSGNGLRGKVLHPDSEEDIPISTGGSSSGAAVVVATNEVDISICTDSGGSARIPAAYNGLIGLKPTFGLVPFTGIFGVERSLDHVAIISKSIFDTAIALEVLSGQDKFDSRCDRVRRPPSGWRFLDYCTTSDNDNKSDDEPPNNYIELANQPSTSLAEVDEEQNKKIQEEKTLPLSGVRIGVVIEALEGGDIQENYIDVAFQSAVEALIDLGAEVMEVSVPVHSLGKSIWTVLHTEGVYNTILSESNPSVYNYGTKDPALQSLSSSFATGIKNKNNQLSDHAKLLATVGNYVQNHYGGMYYTKARNWAYQLKNGYDKLFKRNTGAEADSSNSKLFDVVIMPTVTKLSGMQELDDVEEGLNYRVQGMEDASEETLREMEGERDYMTKRDKTLGGRGEDCDRNAVVFNVTGHPAMSIGCGAVEGEMVGMQIVAGEFEEGRIFKVASALLPVIQKIMKQDKSKRELEEKKEEEEEAKKKATKKKSTGKKAKKSSFGGNK